MDRSFGDVVRLLVEANGAAKVTGDAAWLQTALAEHSPATRMSNRVAVEAVLAGVAAAGASHDGQAADQQAIQRAVTVLVVERGISRGIATRVISVLSDALRTNSEYGSEATIRLDLARLSSEARWIGADRDSTLRGEHSDASGLTGRGAPESADDEKGGGPNGSGVVSPERSLVAGSITVIDLARRAAAERVEGGAAVAPMAVEAATPSDGVTLTPNLDVSSTESLTEHSASRVTPSVARVFSPVSLGHGTQAVDLVLPALAMARRPPGAPEKWVGPLALTISATTAGSDADAVRTNFLDAAAANPKSGSTIGLASPAVPAPPSATTRLREQQRSIRLSGREAAQESVQKEQPVGYAVRLVVAIFVLFVFAWNARTVFLVRPLLMWADLSGRDLRGHDLSGANLSGANLAGANLTDVDLSNAILSKANLNGVVFVRANLRGASMNGATLVRADLTGRVLVGASLSGADLSGARLTDANLAGADLSGANLVGADLSKANLIRADLTRANLTSANLLGANMDGAKVEGVIGLRR